MQKNKYAHFIGFKLVSLEVINHKILGTNIFNFINDTDQPNSLYFSVIIGSNGTGKSILLNYILHLFRSINNGQPVSKKEGFILKYINNHESYEYTNINKNSTEDYEIYSVARFYIDKAIKPLEYKVGLPKSIIANSIMLTDRFIVPRNKKEIDEFPMYHYLGVRNRPQSASTRSYTRRTIEFIVQEMHSELFQKGLTKLVKFLGYKKSVEIIYKTSNTSKFFNKKLSKSILDTYFNDIKNKYKELGKIPPFKLSNYEKIKDNEVLISSLCDFVNNLDLLNLRYYIPRSSAKNITFDILDSKEHRTLKINYKYFEILRSIGLVNAPEIRFVNNKSMDLQNSSSGEFHFFSTMIGLMATVKENSLILIDEPEISLHPNWQMSYINYLRNLFSDDIYKTCQVIIATHSHFIISDLKGESSNIIGLIKEDNEIKSLEIDINTYGWSSEDVLYNIFNVKSPTNYYLQADLTELLGMISNNIKEVNKIETIIKKLKKLPKRDNDPLQEIITESEEYLNSIKND